MHEQTRWMSVSTRARAVALALALGVMTMAADARAAAREAAPQQNAPTRNATSQKAPASGPAPVKPPAPGEAPPDRAPMLLWPDGAPNAAGTTDADVPALTAYLPKTPAPTGVAIVICPGGGYRNLAMDHEGQQVAEWLNSLGVTAFVLKYRLGPRYHHPSMLQDAQRALRSVRAWAPALKLRADRIGIMGFSAGGHLASTAATHFDDGHPAAADAVERAGSRPDFAVLGYPVITMSGPFVHTGSRTHLLGESPDAALVDLLSNEKQVTARTPPTFLFHTDDDPVVPVQNSLLFYAALKQAGVPAELHIYAHGKHGVGLAQADPVLSSWPARLADWLRVRGLLPPAGDATAAASSESPR